MSDTAAESVACQLARFVGEGLDVLGFKNQPLKLLVFACCTGKLSSRKIARAVTRRQPYVILAGAARPTPEQLIELRRAQRGQLESAFRKLFQLCRKLEMPVLGRIQLVGARAPEEQMVFLIERAEQLDRLEEQMGSMLETELSLPAEFADATVRQQRLAEAGRSLELPIAPVAPPLFPVQIAPKPELGPADLAPEPSEFLVETPPRASPSGRSRSRPVPGLSLAALQRAMHKNVSAFVLLGAFLLSIGGYSVIAALPETPKPARKGGPVTPPRPGNMPMLYVGSGLLTAGMLVFVALVALDPAAPKRRRRRRKTRL